MVTISEFFSPDMGQHGADGKNALTRADKAERIDRTGQPLRGLRPVSCFCYFVFLSSFFFYIRFLGDGVCSSFGVVGKGGGGGLFFTQAAKLACRRGVC